VTPTRRALLAGAALTAAPRQPGAQPTGRIHALVVGINAYTGTLPLRGCVNDARLVEQSLRGLDAATTVLLDAEANRAGLLSAWQRAAAQARPGDTFLFHFSGHGARDPRARLTPDDTGGDFLILQPYHPERAPAEILRDTELHALLLDLHRRDVRPMAVLDCCHAGALTRSLDPRAGGGETYRTPGLSQAEVAAAMARLGPPPPRSAPAALDPILFIAAGQAQELVPEIRLPDGTPHGAVSVGFARGIAGAADRDHDGVITRGELFDHILVATRSLAESRQTPVMQPAGRLDQPVLATRGIARRAPPSAAVPFAEAPVRVSIINMPAAEAEALVRAIPGAQRTATPAAEWDLRWDAAARQAFGPGRDLLGSNLGRETLPALVERIRAQRRLASLAMASGLDYRLVWRGARDASENNAAHPAGRRLLLQAANARLPFLVVFNIAGDGRIQMLHPSPRQPEPTREAPVMGFCVTQPFGSDLTVAVASDRPLHGLVQALLVLNGQPGATRLLAPLDAALAGADWQLGLQAVVTRAAGPGDARECVG
jgi:hypothetical protein